jgi:malate dehydrogenase
VGADVYNTVAMQTVAILGAGELGGAVGRALACRDLISRIVLIDKAGAVAAGKALDIRQSGPIEGFDTRLDGTDDVTAVVGAKVVIVADEHGAGGEWTGDAALQLLRRVHGYAERALVVAAGARQRDVLRLAVTELGLPVSRLVGSAPMAASSAARALVALEAGCSATDVSLSVVGAPPGWVIAWADGSAAGSPLVKVLSPPAIARVEARLRASWPCGPNALGSAAASVVHAALTESHRRLSCFVGDVAEPRRSTFVALPVVLGANGVRHVDVPQLAPREQVALDALLRT